MACVPLRMFEVFFFLSRRTFSSFRRKPNRNDCEISPRFIVCQLTVADPKAPEQDFSVWLIRSGRFGLSRFGLGRFGHGTFRSGRFGLGTFRSRDISVHEQLITFVYLNDYRQAKCHAS